MAITIPQYITHELIVGATYTGVAPGYGPVSEVATQGQSYASYTDRYGNLVTKEAAIEPVVGDGTVGPYRIVVLHGPIINDGAAETGEVGPATSVPVSNYTYKLQNTPIEPGSVTVHAPGVVSDLTDDGVGNLSGADGSGTINYLTGEIDVTYTVSVPVGTLTTDYTHTAIVIQDGGQFVTDDGAGNLTGDGTGTVDYDAGIILVTFTAPITAGAELTIGYESATAPARATFDGRVMIYGRRHAGGLITGPDDVGYKLHMLAFNGVGTTQVDLYLVDADGVDYLLISETTAPANFTWLPKDPILVPPGWSLKLVSTGALTAVGRATFGLDFGWTSIPYDA